MIDDQLFGKTRAGILREIYLNPGQRISYSELIRRLRSGDGAVSRELKNLLSMGLISEEREGNQRFLRAARQSPLFGEMRALVSKAAGASRILREALEDVRAKIEVAFIFGSVAKGRDRRDSDLDLLVIGNAGYSVVSERLQHLEKRLGRRVQILYFNPGSPVDRNSLRKPSMQAVLAGPKQFVVGGERELSRFLAKRK